MSKNQNFTEGPIFLPLLKFAMPVLFALFLQAMYGAVDLLIVGQFGGDRAEVYVSAVSTGSMIMHTLTCIVTGIAMGLTVNVGRYIGAKEREKAGRAIGSGIALFAIMSVILTVLMLIFSKAMITVMKAPKEAFDDTLLYVIVCSAGTIFITSYNVLGSVFRGIGDSKTPLITVAIACVFNIVGDLVFVALFGLGALGAALATVMAQAMSVLISLFIIRKKSLPFEFSKKYIKPEKTYMKSTLILGIPIAFQDLLVSISFLAIIAIVNNIGLTQSAGVGVAEKVCAFIMLLPAAYMQSMSAFIAQNMGAGKPKRAQKALLCGIASSLVAGATMFYITFFHGDILAGIFAKDTPIILLAHDYLKAYAIDCLFTAFLFCFVGYFNGCSKTTFVMLQGIIGGICVRLPMSFILSKVTPVSLFRIGLATPISTVVQILLCFIYFILVSKKSKRI